MIQCDGGGGGMARVLSHSHRVQVRVRFVGGREGELRANATLYERAASTSQIASRSRLKIPPLPCTCTSLPLCIIVTLGTSVLGILKGFDQMMNVVLENCVEYLRLVIHTSCMMTMATSAADAQQKQAPATNCDVIIRDPADPTILTDKTRHLGLVVCKGR